MSHDGSQPSSRAEADPINARYTKLAGRGSRPGPGAGGTAIDPEVVAQLLSRRRRGNPIDTLTPRELEVLGLIAEGRSNGAIAAELFVTEGAVEKHVSSIFGKLGLAGTANHPRVLAVLTFLRN